MVSVLAEVKQNGNIYRPFHEALEMPFLSVSLFRTLFLKLYKQISNFYRLLGTQFIVLRIACVLVTAVASTVNSERPARPSELRSLPEMKRAGVDLPLTVEVKPLSIQSSSLGHVRVSLSAHLSSSSSRGVRVQRGYASSSSCSGVMLPSRYVNPSSSGGVRFTSTSDSSSSPSVYVGDPVD